MPTWLVTLSVALLLLAAGCAAWMTADVRRHPSRWR